MWVIEQIWFEETLRNYVQEKYKTLDVLKNNNANIKVEIMKYMISAAEEKYGPDKKHEFCIEYMLEEYINMYRGKKYRNFSDEYMDVQNNTKLLEWYDIHINFIYNELCAIRDSLFIMQEVNRVMDNYTWSTEVTYSAIRENLMDSLAYRVIGGLATIFVGRRGYTIFNTISEIKEQEFYKKSISIQKATDNIVNILNRSEIRKSIEIIKNYRNKLFAHTDVKYVLSDTRIDRTSIGRDIEISVIDKEIEAIGDYYFACFGTQLTNISGRISTKDIMRIFFGYFS